MSVIYIDNQKIEATNGESVIMAAQRNRIDIPHFCWHPELSVAGNCRMCLVEVGTPRRNPDGSFVLDENNEKIISYMPKLQIACNTIVSDEMRININTQKCIDARAAVMEFILINHPLDCPICDEAGGCKLQIYSYHYSNCKSRFTEQKNENSKRVVWNNKIIYDAERCIACTRCGRVSREIAKEDVITMINRGDKVRVECINPDAKDDNKMTNNYSMNVIDTCPVGALTSKDFRFKSRVWDMSFNNSICIGCSRGCNINVGIKNNEVLRISPTSNVYVNKSWMCDDGRFDTAKLINERRTTSLKIRNINVKTTMENAISEAAKILNKSNANDTYFIASPFASNESNYLLSLFAKHIAKGKTDNIGYISRTDNDFADDILRTCDKAPNINGLKALNINIADVTNLIAKIKSHSIKTLVTIEEDFINAEDLTKVFGKVDNLITFSFNENMANTLADIAFPVATFAECEGTFTNCNNRVQYFKPIIAAGNPIEILQSGINQSRLDRFGAKNDTWNQKPIRDVKPTWWILSKLLKSINLGLQGINHKMSASDIFNMMANDVKPFAGMNYDLLSKHQGVTLGKANTPDTIVQNYHSSVMTAN